MTVEYWYSQTLEHRLESAAAEYETTREHPMLFGMQRSMKETAYHFGLQEEALREYLGVKEAAR